MSSSNNNSGGGIGICGVVFIILLILKLFGVISISWWWVFSPLLIGLGIGLFFLIVFLMILKK